MRLGSLAAVIAGLVAAVVVGSVVGYAVGRPAHTAALRPAEIASAAPLPARPSVPIDPFKPYAPDSTYPALSTDLRYTRHRITGSGHTWSYKVPTGWQRYPGTGADAPTRWRPASDDGNYLLRVLPMGASRITPQDQMTLQNSKMAGYADEKVDDSTDDTVWYEYRTADNYDRFNDFAWVRLPGSPYAGFELSVWGRAVDRPGLDVLLETVRDSVTLIR
jgi:hypothetical protein